MNRSVGSWRGVVLSAVIALAISAAGSAPAAGSWPGRNGAVIVTASQLVQSANRPPVLPSGVFAIDPSTRGVRSLLADVPTPYGPAFAADGRLSIGTNGALLVTALDGSGRTSYGSPISPGDHAWLPDGRVGWSQSRIVRSGTSNVCQPVRYELHAARPGANTARRLRTATRHALGPAFSARGKLMAFDGFDTVTAEGTSFASCRVRHPDALWVQRIGVPGTARRLLRFRPQRAGSFHPDFSPDGRRIALVTSHGVVVVRVDGNGSRTLAGTSNARGVAWSPDGRLLAVSIGSPAGPGRGRLVLIPARGGPRRTVVDCTCGIDRVAWQHLPGRPARVAAAAASAVRVLDAAGRAVDALRGTVVWTRNREGSVALMSLVDGRARRVPGVPLRAASVRSLGLGLDSRGRVVAAYLRCNGGMPCAGPFVVDVRRGGERRIALPPHTGCETVKAVSVWRERVAYVLRCRQAARSGVYVKAGARPARRLIGLTAREAKDARVDIGPELVAVASDTLGVRAARTGAQTCRAVLEDPKPPPGAADLGPLQVIGNRISWIRELLSAWGGGTTVLAGAALDAACSVTPTGARPVGYSLVDSFAVDGASLYVASEGRGVTAEPSTAPGR